MILLIWFDLFQENGTDVNMGVSGADRSPGSNFL